jgi:hypothetical protein
MIRSASEEAMLGIRRREFITLLVAAAACPLAARAQQRERMRRVGVLMSLDENDPQEKLRFSAFTQALAGLGWTDGRNVRMELIIRYQKVSGESTGLLAYLVQRGYSRNLPRRKKIR